MFRKKIIVGIIVIISIFGIILLSIQYNESRKMLQKNIVDNWYFIDDYHCESLIIDEESYENRDIVSGFVNKCGEIKLIGGDKLIFNDDRNFKVEFNDDKSQMIITPAFFTKGRHDNKKHMTYEVWTRGKPTKQQIKNFVKNRDEIIADKKAEKAALEYERSEEKKLNDERTLEGLVVTEFWTDVSNYQLGEKVIAGGILKNNSNKVILDVNMRIILGDAIFDFVLLEDDEVLMPGEEIRDYVDFGEVRRKHLSSDNEGTVIIKSYSYYDENNCLKIIGNDKVAFND